MLKFRISRSEHLMKDEKLSEAEWNKLVDEHVAEHDGDEQAAGIPK